MAAGQLSPTGSAGLGAAKPRLVVGRVRAALARAPRRPGTSPAPFADRDRCAIPHCSRAARQEAKDGCWAV
jgi:hypothetical protein